MNISSTSPLASSVQKKQPPVEIIDLTEENEVEVWDSTVSSVQDFASLRLNSNVTRVMDLNRCSLPLSHNNSGDVKRRKLAHPVHGDGDYSRFKLNDSVVNILDDQFDRKHSGSHATCNLRPMKNIKQNLSCLSSSNQNDFRPAKYRNHARRQKLQENLNISSSSQSQIEIIDDHDVNCAEASVPYWENYESDEDDEGTLESRMLAAQLVGTRRNMERFCEKLLHKVGLLDSDIPNKGDGNSNKTKKMSQNQTGLCTMINRLEEHKVICHVLASCLHNLRILANKAAHNSEALFSDQGQHKIHPRIYHSISEYYRLKNEFWMTQEHYPLV